MPGGRALARGDTQGLAISKAKPVLKSPEVIEYPIILQAAAACCGVSVAVPAQHECDGAKMLGRSARGMRLGAGTCESGDSDSVPCPQSAAQASEAAELAAEADDDGMDTASSLPGLEQVNDTFPESEAGYARKPEWASGADLPFYDPQTQEAGRAAAERVYLQRIFAAEQRYLEQHGPDATPNEQPIHTPPDSAAGGRWRWIDDPGWFWVPDHPPAGAYGAPPEPPGWAGAEPPTQPHGFRPRPPPSHILEAVGGAAAEALRRDPALQTLAQDGQIAAIEPYDHNLRSCLRCGCLEPFQDMTDMCCRTLSGRDCIFSLEQQPAADGHAHTPEPAEAQETPAEPPPQPPAPDEPPPKVFMEPELASNGGDGWYWTSSQGWFELIPRNRGRGGGAAWGS